MHANLLYVLLLVLTATVLVGLRAITMYLSDETGVLYTRLFIWKLCLERKGLK